MGTQFAFAMIVWLQLRGVFGIRFVIDKEECLSHNVQYEGDTLHLSFVVVRADSSWHYADAGVDLLINGPAGDIIHDFIDKTSEKYEFIVQQRGIYRFCFKNKSPFHETVDFDVHVGHFKYYEQHAKDEHFNPLLEQISKLEEALYNIQFEQHWLEAQTDRQTLVTESMSQRAMYKAILESLALIGASSFRFSSSNDFLNASLGRLESKTCMLHSFFSSRQFIGYSCKVFPC